MAKSIAKFSSLPSSTAKSPYLQRTDAGQPWSQRKQRRRQMFRDQHGRRWFAETELVTGHPTGPIEPRFEAPLIPPQAYIRMSNDEERPYDILIDYDAWIDERDMYHEEWVKNGRIASRRLHGQKHDPTATEFAMEVLDIIGPEPTPVEPILAAKAGNPWILGLTKTPDRRLVKFFETRESEREKKTRTIDYSKLEALEEENDPNATGGKKKDPRRNHHKRTDKREPAPAGAGA